MPAAPALEKIQISSNSKRKGSRRKGIERGQRVDRDKASKTSARSKMMARG